MTDPATETAPPAAGDLRPIDPREFRNALGRFATGITVVTMLEDEDRDGIGDRRRGITVNAFLSVSLDPPLVAISIDRRANAHATLLEADRYGVSVLRAGQEALSNQFAGRPTDIPDPFGELAGLPVIDGALVQIACRIHAAHEAGDHTLFVGRVEALRYGDGAPLLYYQGKYAKVEGMELHE